MHLELPTAEDTRELGRLLGLAALPGDVLWLHGELGAGKTEMTKGIAAGAETDEPVSSPSFALVHEYRGGRLPVFHIDLYRLEADAAMDMGLEEYIEGDGLTVIEWGERLPRGYFTDGLDISLTYGDEGDIRHAILRPRGMAGEAWLARLSSVNEGNNISAC